MAHQLPLVVRIRLPRTQAAPWRVTLFYEDTSTWRGCAALLAREQCVGQDVSGFVRRWRQRISNAGGLVEDRLPRLV